jgi:hypothetical protein
MWFGKNQLKLWPVSKETMSKIKEKKKMPQSVPGFNNPKLAALAERWRQKKENGGGSFEIGQIGPIKGTICQKAKSGKSTCRICKSFINNRELRVGVPHPEYEGSYKWHHVTCAIERKIVWPRLVTDQSAREVFNAGVGEQGGRAGALITNQHYRYQDGVTVVFQDDLYTYANGQIVKLTGDPSEKSKSVISLKRLKVIRNEQGKIDKIDSDPEIGTKSTHSNGKPIVFGEDGWEFVNLEMTKTDPEDLNGLPMTPRDWDNLAKKRKSLDEQLADIDKKYDSEISRIKRNAWSRRKAKKEPQIEKKVGSAIGFVRLLAITAATSVLMTAAVAAITHFVQ